MKRVVHDETLCEYDMAYVRGHMAVKRTLEIAAAGLYSILLVGNAGTGKTLLAWSLAPLLPEACHAPIRQIQPGEKVLSEGELLFLKDMHTWQPCQLADVWSSDVKRQVIGTVQQCPCGFYGDRVRECVCTIEEIREYQKYLCPALDAFDMHVTVSMPEVHELLDNRPGESSASIRARVERAYALREQRGVIPAHMTLTVLQQDLDQEGEKLLRSAIRQLYLTPQNVARTLRLARTIADLAREENIRANAIAEAIQYRAKLRN